MAVRRLRPLLCGLIAVGLSLPTAAPVVAQQPQKADLSVAAVTLQATATAGADLTVRVKVRNHGRRAAPASTTALSLSSDPQRGDDEVLKSVRTPKLGPGRTWSGRARVTIPGTTSPGTYHVLACADAKRRVPERREGDNCRASDVLTVQIPATSHDLIEEDVAAGVLTPEEGLVFKVFSDFEDPRLPGKYVGAGDGLAEGALQEAAQSWDALSAQAQDTLRPYLIPPFHAGSHWNSETSDSAGRSTGRALLDAPWCSGGEDVNPVYESWDHVDTFDGLFRIWWLKDSPDDVALAEQMSTALATIMPALTSLMGHSYKSDNGGLCGGGSDAFDIAIVPAATAQVYGDGDCGAEGTSAHMVWPRTAPSEWAGIEPYLAHEVMHTIQYGMATNGGCGEYLWLREMTAQWVQDYVTDPLYGVGLGPDDTEHLAAPLYLDRPNVSLDADSPARHAYGDYLLAQWAARKGSQQFVPEVWANAATMKPKPAVDAALPGDGFESTWADFALSNWNRGSIDDYARWDQMTLGAKAVGPEPIPLGKPRNPTIHVNSLAAQYLELDLDPGIMELEVKNDLAGDDHAKLRAVVRYDDGTEKVVDMSENPTTVLCIDDGTRRAVSVVLIFSNAHQTDGKDFAPTLTGSATCGCPNVPATRTSDASLAEATCTGNITFSWTEETVKMDANGVDERYHWTESATGTLGLGFLPPEPDSPEVWPMDPASTYDVSYQSHREYYWGCEEVVDTTQEGSGTLGDLATAAFPALDSDDLWVNKMILMKTRRHTHSESLCGPSDSEDDSSLIVPSCPPGPESDPWTWTLEPAGEDSYRIDCSETVVFEDGLGEHTITVSVTGTVTLP